MGLGGRQPDFRHGGHDRDAVRARASGHARVLLRRALDLQRTLGDRVAMKDTANALAGLDFGVFGDVILNRQPFCGGFYKFHIFVFFEVIQKSVVSVPHLWRLPSAVGNPF